MAALVFFFVLVDFGGHGDGGVGVFVARVVFSWVSKVCWFKF